MNITESFVDEDFASNVDNSSPQRHEIRNNFSFGNAQALHKFKTQFDF